METALFMSVETFDLSLHIGAYKNVKTAEPIGKFIVEARDEEAIAGYIFPASASLTAALRYLRDIAHVNLRGTHLPECSWSPTGRTWQSPVRARREYSDDSGQYGVLYITQSTYLDI